MRSKYVQSRIGNTYKEAEEFLKQGRKVLFIGTSCQIAGLRKFLCKQYINLLAVDFICHGVPSPGVWRKYLAEIKKNNSCSKSLVDNHITEVNFREKQLGGYCWKDYGLIICKTPSDNGSRYLLSCKYKQNSYFKAFLGDLSIRPSCYSCVAKNGASNSDITLGDFWGIQSFYPDFDDDKGVGLIVIHTECGKNSIEQISESLEMIETDLQKATLYNKSYYTSVEIPDRREKFWSVFYNTSSVCTATEEALKQTFVKRVYIKSLFLIYSLKTCIMRVFTGRIFKSDSK